MGATPNRARIVLTRLVAVACGTAIALGGFAGPAIASEAPSASTRHPARPSYADQLGHTSPMARSSSSSSSSSVMPYQPYTDWSWAVKGATSTSETLKITKVDAGSRYFWAYDFAVGGTGVGYSGLQAGSYPSTGKIALFAIWGADGAEGGNCSAFDGEGLGWTCRLDPFAWTVGRSYALEISVDGTDETGTWYKATVRDLVTKKVSPIGRIHHPAAGGKVTGRGSWTEWFGGTAASCAALKRSTVEWGVPTSNAGRDKATSHVNHTAPKDGSRHCPGETTVVDGPGIVRQSIGPSIARK
jgi:hypothetical protein